MKYLLLCLISFQTLAQNITLSGYIKEKGSQESILGASIRVPSLSIGTQSNTYGFYSITIPKKDSNTIMVSMIGYQSQMIKLSSLKNQMITIFLENQNEILDEVIIKANEPEQKSTSTKISTINIPIAQLKDVPSLMGEKDIIKAIQLLPGVQTGTEGSNGLFVRGGSTDQNLILMDEAKLYNVSHLFGFFSVFNGDALKSVEFIKGGFPARYGGRVKYSPIVGLIFFTP
jgi:CarboxypepD_reg-like domain/TonB-dependent Receptor Plug Domain